MVTLTCKLIEADQPTVNGQIYPKEVLESLAKQINADAQDGHMVGELGWDGGMKVSLAKASHRVEPTAKLTGGRLVVDITPLDTPTGQILQRAIQDRVELTLSSGT